MKKTHYTRERVHQQRKKRRYPFSIKTKIENLFRLVCRKERMAGLMNDLAPYLDHSLDTLYQGRGIYIRAEALDGYRKNIYLAFAMAIRPWKDGKSPLKVSKTVFFRYLADKAHSNLEVSEISLKKQCDRALREYFNII